MDTHKSLSNQNTDMIFIENCVTKIGGLLSVGFGEAGSKIIHNQMHDH